MPSSNSSTSRGSGSEKGVPAEGLRFQVVDGEREFLNLRASWEALHRQRDDRYPEHSFARALAAWETLARPRRRKLHIVVGRVADEVVLILPLTAQRLGPFTVARWLGPEFYETCDVLVRQSPESDGWVARAWDFTLGQVDLLRLPAVRATASLWPLLQGSPHSQWDPIVSVYIDSRQWPGWDEYYRSRSGNFRKDHRNSLKRLDRAGAVRWNVVEGRERLAETLEWMFAHKLDWLSRTGRDSDTLAQRKAFYHASCGRALDAGELVLLELLVDDVRIAAQIGFRAGSRLDCDMIAWDPAWKDCSPGRALDIQTIRWAFEHSIRFIELGVFGHESKYRFTDEAVETAFNIFVPAGARGRSLLYSKAILKGLRDRSAQVMAAARTLTAKAR